MIAVYAHTGSLDIEGPWYLRSAEGQIVDERSPVESRSHFELWRIVGTTITSSVYVGQPMPTLFLDFSNGLILEIGSEDDGYEDWTARVTESDALIIINGPE